MTWVAVVFVALAIGAGLVVVWFVRMLTVLSDDRED